MFSANPVVKMTMDNRAGQHVKLGKWIISVEMDSKQPDIELYAAKVVRTERKSNISTAAGLKKAITAYEKADRIFEEVWS